MKKIIPILTFFLISCVEQQEKEFVLNREQYKDQLEGFWLGECLGNWTGLITEMDKVGFSIDGKGEGFYTRENWGGPDEPNLWGSNNYSPTIDFLYAKKDSIWGADDDTDLEYMYQELLLRNNTTKLTGEQIRQGWLSHIKKEEENYLWVSNQRAFDLMQEGMVPPATSDSVNNPNFEMIDAQLTTEIFGLYAPGRPEMALEMAYLPVRTTASGKAADIAEFYIIMHSLAPLAREKENLKAATQWMAQEARKHLPEGEYPARMYDFVWSRYQENIPWEQVRDELHEKYQVRGEDGYTWSSRDAVCRGCFAAGINFGASLISLFYGEGDLKETIKIGVLCGWDSDNPTATWSGMIGFMMGRKAIEEYFGMEFSERFNIHRTRINFENGGIDNFPNMAEKGLKIVEQVLN